MIITFPGQEGVSIEIFAKYLFMRQTSDFGSISAVKYVLSRHSLQIECWFLDNNASMDHMDRMNTSCPGHEGVSDEINAKYLNFDDFSDFAISPAHRHGFCERMCPPLQVGVDRPHSTFPWDHGRLFIRENAGRYVVWCLCEGHDGRLGGQNLRLMVVWDF